MSQETLAKYIFICVECCHWQTSANCRRNNKTARLCNNCNSSELLMAQKNDFRTLYEAKF